MSDSKKEELLEEEKKEVHPEPHIPEVAKKISKFGNQGNSKFGKGVASFNPPNKQRPGRAAARGR